MDYKNLTKMLIKIAGLLIIVFAIIDINDSIIAYMRYPTGAFFSFFWLSIIHFLVPMILGGFLWHFPARITNSIIKEEPTQGNKESFIPQLQQVAISVLGLYLLFTALSDMAYYISYQENIKDILESDYRAQSEIYGSMFSVAIQIILALFLIFGAKGMVNLINKVWQLGKA